MAGPLLSVAGVVLRGSLVENRLRTAIAVLAIALGVALGYAVQLINGAAVNELTQGVHLLAGDADLEIRGPRGGFDERLFAELARVDGVAVASPVVEIDAKVVGRDEPLHVLGIDVFRAGSIQPGLVGASSDRLDTLRPDMIFLSPAAARFLDSRRGDRIEVVVGLASVPLTVAGILSEGGGERFGVMDIAGAQAAFDRLGRVSRIDLRLAPGVEIDAFATRAGRRLPAGLAMVRPETTVAASASLSRSYRVNLNVLALVALFTGSLLVFSTEAHAVVRRRAQFALLRVLGVKRRQLATLIVVEGALVGIAGSLIGLGLGAMLAALSVRWGGGDLGSGYFRGVTPSIVLDPSTLSTFFLIGVAAAALGSVVPALDIARAPPAAALKAGDEERPFERLRSPWPGLAAFALAGFATLAPPVDGLPLFGYAAISLLLFGTLMLMPRVAASLLAHLPRPRSPAPRLALAQLSGTAGQVSVSLAAIVASVSLTVSMVIMVASFRNSLDAWLERILPADLYVRAATAGDTAYLSPEAQNAIAALPGVRRVEFLREQQLLIDPMRPRVVLAARTIDPRDPARNLAIVSSLSAVAEGEHPPVWVSEAAADLYGFVPGRVIALPIAGKAERFTVAGVFRDYGRQQGTIAIERQRYVALTGDHAATGGALWLSGVSRADIEAKIEREIPGGERLEFASPGEIRDTSLKIFDRTFAVTYALELAAMVIGLFGLSSSFGALVLARKREFGVLRHLGMTRGQIGAMLASEGLMVSGIGLLIGVVLGFVLSLILIHVVNRQSFHWEMELSLPWVSLTAFGVVLLALSTVTALASGRQAMGDSVVRAVKDDW
jgi:putative ABC transport system permease protein